MKKYKYQILLWTFILAYIIYFSYLTVLRYKTLYASYYDLGIMHQTAYNTFKSLSTGDWGRFLELTNPVGSDQIKRMAIHNDFLLALLSPFYFINSGPETLLTIQTVVVALGAFAIFKIANIVLQKNKLFYFLSFVFSLAYLLYPPLERANIYDFHAVTLATTFLLFMFYFWLARKYVLSFLFFILSLISKEQVALTTMMFGLYSFANCHCERLKGAKQSQSVGLKGLLRRFAPRNDREWFFSFSILILSIFWFILSVFYAIPIFRGGQHFAIKRYADFGDSPIRIIIGIMTNPYSISKYLFRVDSLKYLNFLLGPVGFLSLLSPTQLLIALPEFAINLLSKNPNMRNIIYHYTAVITPFVFISAIYGAKRVIEILRHSGKRSQVPDGSWRSASRIVVKNNDSGQVFRQVFDREAQTESAQDTEQSRSAGMTKKPEIYIGVLLLFFSLYFAYQKGPLPFAKGKNIHPFKYPQKEAKDAAFWGRTLRDESLKISTTGQLSPFFTSRRYFYSFSARYRLADYVIVRLNEIYNYPDKNELIPVYERLKV
ncbi:DUF2079 domain-containing protein, partial [Candidatus Roizmanbacteria bacterium]|nr:DUF2079 domain-containing protein [Candidatus Roizmanbacteria bacterium]